MKLVPHNAFLKFSGEQFYCFEEPTDGSQNLCDWIAMYTNAYLIANIPLGRWADFIQAHLIGPAAQEARTLRRDNPLISWATIVDTFKTKFTVIDEQTQLRAKLQPCAPINLLL